MASAADCRLGRPSLTSALLGAGVRGHSIYQVLPGPALGGGLRHRAVHLRNQGHRGSGVGVEGGGHASEHEGQGVAAATAGEQAVELAGRQLLVASPLCARRSPTLDLPPTSRTPSSSARRRLTSCSSSMMALSIHSAHSLWSKSPTSCRVGGSAGRGGEQRSGRRARHRVGGAWALAEHLGIAMPMSSIHPSTLPCHLTHVPARMRTHARSLPAQAITRHSLAAAPPPGPPAPPSQHPQAAGALAGRARGSPRQQA